MQQSSNSDILAKPSNNPLLPSISYVRRFLKPTSSPSYATLHSQDGSAPVSSAVLADEWLPRRVGYDIKTQSSILHAKPGSPLPPSIRVCTYLLVVSLPTCFGLPTVLPPHLAHQPPCAPHRPISSRLRYSQLIRCPLSH